MIKKLTRNPYLIFLPFLLFYGYFIVINKWPVLFGDEIRYVDFARNLLHGFYSPPMPHINLWNGPGYPLLLAPFLALHIPALYITLLNAVFQYLAIVFLYQSLRLLANRKIALVFSLLLAFYPNVLSVMPILYTEAFTGFLVSTFVYCIALHQTKKKNKYAVLAGLVLGYLVLTKIIFGYVLVVCLMAYLVLLLFKKNRPARLGYAKILAIAFAVTIPYLVYTWQLTGKAFYWGNSGGMSLYWMSTPFEGEYGDWKVPELTNNQYPAQYIPSAAAVAVLKKYHSREMKFILEHNELQRDELFKQKALMNIKRHPLKFIDNYIDNFSRMLFNFPYSYSLQDNAIVRNILTGSLILWGSIIGIIITLVNRQQIIAPIKFILTLTGVYFALSGALSSYPRQLDVMAPVLLFWIGYLIFHLRKFSLKFEKQEDPDTINLMQLAEAGKYSEETV